MDQEIRIEMSQIVGKIAGVLIQPYAQFIAKLHEEGRVSAAEVQGVIEQFDEKMANLPDYLMKDEESAR